MTDLELQTERERFARAVAAGTAPTRELHDFQLALQWDVFGAPAHERREDIAADDPRVEAIVDALEALAVLEADDASHPWSRANVLFAVGRHAEAATDYLRAAELFAADRAAADNDDWAHSARLQAATNFALAGESLAARSLLLRLEPSERAEVESLLAASAAPGRTP